MTLSDALSLSILTLLASLATWRLTYMVNQEDGPFDVFVRFRSLVGLREFNSLTTEERQEWVVNNELPLDGTLPRYVHSGNTAAKWVECHGCLSVSVALILLSYMALMQWVPFSYIPVGVFVASFGSIFIQLRLW